jgi:type I restriction enzyme, S subunit
MSQGKALPKEWKWVKLGEVCKLRNGYAFKSSDYKDTGVPIIRISDINGRTVLTEKAVRIEHHEDFNDYIVEKEDILVAMSGATTGKFGIYKSTEKAYQNQRVGNFIITKKDQLGKQFLFHQIDSLKRKIEQDAYGGAQPNISSKKIEEMEIVLPPLSTQAQIVEKLETLLSELDKGKAQLLTAQAQLKTYRQAVLKYAFEGKLTGNTEGWQYANLKDVCKVLSGFAFKSSDFIENGIPVIKIGNVGYSEFHWKEQQFVSASTLEKSKSFRVFGDDILIALTRPITNNVLKVCKYPLNSGFGLLNQRVAAIKDITIDKKYLFAFFQTEEFKKYLKSKFSETLQPNLSPKDLELAPIPFPPLSIQSEIVTEIERRLSVCDHLEGTIKTGLAQSETLRQSLLKQAFEGRLV